MALLLRVVVGESDRGEVELGVLEQLPQNHVSGGAGAHDQCTLAGSRAGVLLPRSQRPDEQARGAHDCAAQERVEDRDRDGQARGSQVACWQQHQAERGAGHRGRGGGLDDLRHVGDAGVRHQVGRADARNRTDPLRP